MISNGIEVIPGILESDWEKVKNKINLLYGLSGWVHVDVSDGIFTPNTTWANPKDLLEVIDINVEVHLMIEMDDSSFNNWIQSNAKRIIVHWESFKDSEIKIKEVSVKAKERGKEIVLAFKPDTDWQEAERYLLLFNSVLFLEVTPGYSGQGFQESGVSKITSFKAKYPNILAEVDGGIKPSLLTRLIGTGAERFVSTSYIFSGGHVEEKIKEYQEEIEKLNL